jgi:tryptophanyl-tRNA synthetase
MLRLNLVKNEFNKEAHMAIVLSGIKPTGQLTLGNYIGALKRFPSFQNKDHPFIFIADLHALTVPIDPEVLKTNIIDIAAFYLAAGLDPKKSTIFIQSQVSAHAELNTILQNFIYMGELSRMTQFKDKVQTLKENAIGLGLFAYPVLMASDILLYDAEIVPVGEDQIQHIELTRDLVKRFNNRFGEVLVLPKAEISAVGKRVMSLADPTKKMSKSDPKGNIDLKEDLTSVRKKIMSAVTDSGDKIYYDEVEKPGISNLLTIYATLKDISIKEAELEFAQSTYGTFKKAVADTVVSTLTDLQIKYNAIIASGEVERVLNHGREEASKLANTTLNRVKKAVGLM